MFERLLALLLLIIVLPVVVIVAIVVIHEDGIPFIFKQHRVGIGGKPFLFYKIRTMRKGMPEISTSQLVNMGQWVLKSGYFLRKYSIDETLNLINIVKGEMSFIGPRPLILSETFVHNERKRLGIINQKPGITGWAQVNGRDVISDDRKLELEKYYLENKSIRLNLIIVLKTIFYIFGAVRQKIVKPLN
jgi:O-antigen biosynthesis protein WbqP